MKASICRGFSRRTPCEAWRRAASLMATRSSTWILSLSMISSSLSLSSLMRSSLPAIRALRRFVRIFTNAGVVLADPWLCKPPGGSLAQPQKLLQLARRQIQLL